MTRGRRYFSPPRGVPVNPTLPSTRWGLMMNTIAVCLI